MRRPKFLHKMWNVSSSLINQPISVISSVANILKFNCREHLKSHGGGPALGQAGELSRLDRWRSWVKGIKGFWGHSVHSVPTWKETVFKPAQHWNQPETPRWSSGPGRRCLQVNLCWTSLKSGFIWFSFIKHKHKKHRILGNEEKLKLFVR